MAITFSKSLSTTNLLNGYNNNVVEFTSNAIPGGETITKAVVNIGGTDFTISPNISNVLRFNFKEAVRVLINDNNFSDDILPLFLPATPGSHVYDDTANTYLEELVTYTITFSDATTEQTTETYKFFKSIEQLEQNKKGVVTTGGAIYMLSPFKKATADTYNVTYFEGYPFDISLYLETPGITNILNQTNALDYNFTMSDTINRLYFSDGRVTISIDDYLPLVDGLNELKITRGGDVIYVNLTKVPSVQGEYVKWLNQYGQWNYWLFNCRHRRDKKTKDLGNVFNDFDDVSLITLPSYGIGKESTDTLTLISKNVSAEDQEVLDGIYESPRVYFYTGVRFTQNTAVSWLGATNVQGTNNIVDYKRDIKNYKVKIELPERYTMRL